VISLPCGLNVIGMEKVFSWCIVVLYRFGFLCGLACE
jgi:hypothetical protein